MKLSVCLLFLGCLVLVAEAMSEPREEDLQDLLTELEDLVDELEVTELGMEKRNQVRDNCIRDCTNRRLIPPDHQRCVSNCNRVALYHGKRDEVEDFAAEEEVTELGMEKRNQVRDKCIRDCTNRRLIPPDHQRCVSNCNRVALYHGKREEVEDFAAEEEVTELGMEKRNQVRDKCIRDCTNRRLIPPDHQRCVSNCNRVALYHGKRDEVEDFSAEEEVAEVGMEKRSRARDCHQQCFGKRPGPDFQSCHHGCMAAGKRNEVEDLEAEEEELQEEAFLA
ncbi:PREDICTED: uncharacterized protein LOC109472027 isoform X1 [Branchiostoma belcheri]|uniref:Uncharacterized protein LOC109472027 isoform X1 n=1 Tax=Branchiostoma belcheri TaxID=7741 RepID=A0A6P4YDB5_BRABE|nr:PREDICTED: uncharacterized protein LOC109472027 isoform X1 [Branchiostoma belcheri]